MIVTMYRVQGQKLVQTIVTIYRVQAYQVPIVNPTWPPKIQDCRHGIFYFFSTFQHQTAVFPAHHRDRLVNHREKIFF